MNDSNTISNSDNHILFDVPNLNPGSIAKKLEDVDNMQDSLSSGVNDSIDNSFSTNSSVY